MSKPTTIALEERIAALESQISDLIGLSSIKALLEGQRAERDRADKGARLNALLMLPADEKYAAIRAASAVDRRALVEMSLDQVMLVANAPDDLRNTLRGMLRTSEQALKVDVEMLARAGQLPRYARVRVSAHHAARNYRWTPAVVELDGRAIEELRAHGFGDRIAYLGARVISCDDNTMRPFEPHAWAAGEPAHTWTVFAARQK